MFKNSTTAFLGLAILVVIGASAFILTKGSVSREAPAISSLAQLAPAAGEEAAMATTPETTSPVPETAADTAKPSETPAAVPAADEDTAKADANSSMLLAPMSSEMQEMTKDRVLGNDDAPVTIIEYASLTCSHCAHFATQILPQVKKRLIDTGKARLIYRDFPLDNLALKAAMMARCVPADKFFNVVEVIFNNQDRWTRDKEPLKALAQIGSLAGLDQAGFDKCMDNKALETALLGVMQDAQSKYDLKATPSFIFNNGAEKFSGAQSVEQFATVVDKLSKGK